MSDANHTEEETIKDISRQFNLSEASVRHLVEALRRGGGSMAQFQCEEFGTGQWMRGGMTMVSDMFNHQLRARVDEVLNIIAKTVSMETPTTNISSPGRWWPADLGEPASTGSQNQIHYAVFPGARRLAIQREGKVSIYDTGSHKICGVSQQQGTASGIKFSSQLGSFTADSLPLALGAEK